MQQQIQGPFGRVGLGAFEFCHSTPTCLLHSAFPRCVTGWPWQGQPLHLHLKSASLSLIWDWGLLSCPLFCIMFPSYWFVLMTMQTWFNDSLQLLLLSLFFTMKWKRCCLYCLHFFKFYSILFFFSSPYSCKALPPKEHFRILLSRSPVLSAAPFSSFCLIKY